ncbi:indole-3-glycerol-phosphate synthase TrpC, partial [Mycobacterium tuberculosis]|nr:indole-3-glycerol-phosphate synthase TrpC [Mycobacterium tuberculosis]
MLSALVDEADPPTKLFRSAATGRVAAVLVSADHLEFRDADLDAVRASVSIPVLRKDFVVQ